MGDAFSSDGSSTSASTQRQPSHAEPPTTSGENARQLAMACCQEENRHCALESVQRLLKKRVDANAVSNGMSFPIALAVLHGNFDIARELLIANADVSDGSASHIAQAKLADRIGLGILLAAGQPVNAHPPYVHSAPVDFYHQPCSKDFNHSDCPLLHIAVLAGLRDSVHVLLEARADPISKSVCRRRCSRLLPLASRDRNVQLVRVLLEARADVHLPSDVPADSDEGTGYMPLEAAVLLLDCVNASEDTAPARQISRDSADIVNLLLDAAAEVNRRDVFFEKRNRRLPIGTDLEAASIFHLGAFNAHAAMALLRRGAVCSRRCRSAVCTATLACDLVSHSYKPDILSSSWYNDFSDVTLVLLSLLQAKGDITLSVGTNSVEGIIGPKKRATCGIALYGWSLFHQLQTCAEKTDHNLIMQAFESDLIGSSRFGTVLAILCGRKGTTMNAGLLEGVRSNGIVSAAILPGIRFGMGNGFLIRTPAPCLIEALLNSDVDALCIAVKQINDLCDHVMQEFKAELQTHILKVFPEATVIEAGSSGRGSNVTPISDVDLTVFPVGLEPPCCKQLRALQQSLKDTLQEVHPEWHVDIKKLAVTVFAPVPSCQAAACYGNKLKIDICIASSNDLRASGCGFAAHALGRKAILDELPLASQEAAQILRVMLKSVHWPSYDTRPPMYMVDVLVKYIVEFGAPRICMRRQRDARPHCNVARLCCMFLRNRSLFSPKEVCSCCKELPPSHFFECLACGTVVCEKQCVDRLAVKVGVDHALARRRFPFPTTVSTTFGSRPLGRNEGMGNRMWKPRDEIRSDQLTAASVRNVVIAFFHLGAWFDTCGVIWDVQAYASPSAAVLPYVQDPACPENNIAERFNYRPFMQMCFHFVDDTSHGLLDFSGFQQMRSAFFQPFRAAPPPQEIISVLIWFCDLEDIFECHVNVQWPFARIFESFTHTELADVAFRYAWSLDIVDKHGVVEDWSQSMAARGVGLGSMIGLMRKHMDFLQESDIEKSGAERHAEMVRLFNSPGALEVLGDIEDSELRRSRFLWVPGSLADASQPFHKVLVDRQTGGVCYFAQSLNQVRRLGPDFDNSNLENDFVDAKDVAMSSKVYAKVLASRTPCFFARNDGTRHAFLDFSELLRSVLFSSPDDGDGDMDEVLEAMDDALRQAATSENLQRIFREATSATSNPSEKLSKRAKQRARQKAKKA